MGRWAGGAVRRAKRAGQGMGLGCVDVASTLELELRCKGAPMWTIGPSRPRGMLVLVMRVMPTTLATSVLAESMPSRMYVPVGWGGGV